jgi:Ras GTPase-activating-like protein IQGAP2/3
MSTSPRSEVPTRISSAKDRSKRRERQHHNTSEMSVATMLQPASRASTSTSSSFEPVSRQNTMSSHDGQRSMRQSKRVSMTALYVSMSAKEQDLQISDDLARAQRTLRDFKSKISSQSKKNFVLEKDVRYLDSRIALLIQNRMALEEVCETNRRIKVINTNDVAAK